MDPEEDQNQQDQDQQSLSDQGLTKKIAKKGLQSLRGIGVAGETAGAETGAAATGTATTTAAAGAETATAVGAAEGLGAAAAGAATTTAAAGAATTEGVLTGAAITSGSSFGMWALAITLIAVFVITIIVVITGGGAGTNLGSGSPSPEPGPGPKLPEIINFKGGHAYLSCSKTERINCNNLSPDRSITMFAIFYIDDTFPASLKDTAKIIIGPFDTSFFDIFNFLSKDIKPRPDTYTPLSPNYTWKLSTVLRLGEKGSGPNEYIISMGVGKPLKGDATKVTLSLKGFQDVTGGRNSGSGGIYAGIDNPPSTDACEGGKYNSIMTGIKKDFKVSAANFGDPVCSYSTSNLKQLIETTESKPENVNFWMDIAKCESPGNGPNGYSRTGEIGDSEQAGIWGNFQMRRSFPTPLKKWTELSDRGDVTWQRQAQNAISWNNARAREGNNFVYWESAYCLCSADRYKNQSFCADIKRKGLAKSCSRCQ